jgi:predicted O-methyltransferase YrrM
MEYVKKYFFALFACIYLFAGGFLFKKNRSLVPEICARFGFGKEKPLIPVLSIGEALKGSGPVTIDEIHDLDGNISAGELAVLNGLVRKYAPQRIFEIGTFDGRTTLNFSLNTSAGTRIFTLDLPAKDMGSVKLKLDTADAKFILKNEVGARFKNCKEGKITQLFGDSASFDFSGYHDSIDFMFVDGSHAYDYVVSDTRAALKLVKKNGLIVWHDYNSRFWKDVTVGLNEFYKNGGEFSEMFAIEDTTLVVLRRGNT